MLQQPQWVVWNIFLGAIPVVLAYALAIGVERSSMSKKGSVPLWLWTPLLLAWLAFLPNACYLLTEWRHFLLNPYSPVAVAAQQPGRADKNGFLMLTVFQQSWIFFLYTGFGLLFFALSIRPLERLLQSAKVSLGFRFALGAVLFLLVSLGVYLGLIVRLNSWDLIQHPMKVVYFIVDAVTDPVRLRAIVVFAVLLAFLYKIVDIWIDGLLLRFKASGAK